MLKFLVDHNIPKSVSAFLKKGKYDVKLVKEIDPEMTDVQIVLRATREDRVIISNDKDFLGLSVKYPHVDMILFDYRNQSAEVRILGLKQILPKMQKGFGIVIVQ